MYHINRNVKIPEKGSEQKSKKAATLRLDPFPMSDSDAMTMMMEEKAQKEMMLPIIIACTVDVLLHGKCAILFIKCAKWS